MKEVRAKDPSAGVEVRAEEREKEAKANKLKESNSLVPFPSLLADERIKARVSVSAVSRERFMCRA